jgi:hypothetical protein
MARPRGRLVLRMLTTLAALGVLYFLIRAGLDFYKVCVEEESEATQKAQIFTSSRGALVIVFGFGLIAFHFVVQLLLDGVFVVRRKEPPPHWIAEAHGGEAPPETGQDLVEPAPDSGAVAAASDEASPSGAVEKS